MNVTENLTESKGKALSPRRINFSHGSFEAAESSRIKQGPEKAEDKHGNVRVFRYKRIDAYGDPRHINSVHESPFIEITNRIWAMN